MRRGRPGEPAWKNNLDSLYDRLKKRDVFERLTRGDPWTLSASGLAEVSAYAPMGEAPVPEGDLLANFRPKDGSDYIARLEGRELVKARSHEKLIADYGKYVATRNWRPRTDVHPRDLVLQTETSEVLVEAKVLYQGNATEAVRAALAQLLMYRHFLYEPSHRITLLALFSEPIGAAHEAFLENLGIASVWAADGHWQGTITAKAKLLT